MPTYTAFDKFNQIAAGSLDEVALQIKHYNKTHSEAQVLLFSDLNGRQIDLDLSGSDRALLDRLRIYTSAPVPSQNTVGRPRLGVVAREVSLLPAHWEWLMNQDGGASATIRRLIDEKIKSSTRDNEKIKLAQEATYKFLSSLAGDLPLFEEATRYLYRKDKKNFENSMQGWPRDVVRHAQKLSQDVF
jgi:hypothetical protein